MFMNDLAHTWTKWGQNKNWLHYSLALPYFFFKLNHFWIKFVTNFDAIKYYERTLCPHPINVYICYGSLRRLKSGFLHAQGNWFVCAPKIAVRKLQLLNGS